MSLINPNFTTLTYFLPFSQTNYLFTNVNQSRFTASFYRKRNLTFKCLSADTGPDKEPQKVGKKGSRKETLILPWKDICR